MLANSSPFEMGKTDFEVTAPDVQAPFPDDTPVTIVLQRFTTEGWQTAAQFFSGVAINGHRPDDPHRSILPDEAQPAGDEYASQHPITYDFAPRARDIAGVRVLARYAFEPTLVCDVAGSGQAS